MNTCPHSAVPGVTSSSRLPISTPAYESFIKKIVYMFAPSSFQGMHSTTFFGMSNVEYDS